MPVDQEHDCRLNCGPFFIHGKSLHLFSVWYSCWFYLYDYFVVEQCPYIWIALKHVIYGFKCCHFYLDILMLFVKSTEMHVADIQLVL